MRRVAFHLRTISVVRRYLAAVSEVYFIVIFTEIYTNGLALCSMIFCHLTIDWENLYFVIVLTLCKLFGFCLMGTMVEISVGQLNLIVACGCWCF